MVACVAQWRDSILGCDDAGLQDQVRDIETASRMLHSVMLETLAELDFHNIAASTGFGTTKRLLAGMLQLSPTEARTRVAHAGQLAPRRAMNGEALPPTLPNTAAALAAGEIGPAQVRVIAETMDAIPTTVSVTDRQAAEAELARHARSFNPRSLHTIGRHILAHLDPDGHPPRDEPEPTPTAGEFRFWERRDGAWGWRDSWSRSTAPRSATSLSNSPHLAQPPGPSPIRAPSRNATPTRCSRSAGWPVRPRTARPLPGNPHISPSPSTGMRCAPAWELRPWTTARV